MIKQHEENEKKKRKAGGKKGKLKMHHKFYPASANVYAFNGEIDGNASIICMLISSNAL